MKKTITGIFLCVSAFIYVSAQDTNPFMQEYNKLILKTDSLEKNSKTLKESIMALEETVKMKDAVIDSLRLVVTNIQDNDGRQTATISTLQAEVESLKKNADKFDDISLRYANGRLQLSYNEARVKEAIELFDSIRNPDMKKEFIDIRNYLLKYPEAMQSVDNTLKELNESTKDYNMTKIDEWKRVALGYINKNPFYNKMTAKGVSYYFLDDILNEAAARVRSANDPKKITFTDLHYRIYPSGKK